MRAVLGLAGLLLLLLGGGWYAVRVYDVPGPLPAARAVVVPRGGLDQVADALTQEGVVDSPSALRLAALATRGQGALRAGAADRPLGAAPPNHP